jgi:hypothetical protein
VLKHINYTQNFHIPARVTQLQLSALFQISLAVTMPTLPEELLVLIFEHLASPNVFELDAQMEELHEQKKRDERLRMISDHSARNSTLRNVCMASKSLHRLTWPILYRDYNNRRPKDIHGLEHHPGYNTPTRNLLKTICLTPHYGHALRNLLIKAWIPVGAMNGLQIFDLLQTDATVSAMFQWRLRGYWFYDGEFCDQLDRALGLGHEDGLLTLLLIMCPNIRELEMEPPIDFSESLFTYALQLVYSDPIKSEPLPAFFSDPEQEEADYMIAQMFGVPWPDQKWQKPLYLNSLNKLTLWSPGLENLDLDCIVPIFMLPSLLTFTAWGLNCTDSYGWVYKRLKKDGRKSNLKSLELHCSASTDMLKAVLEFCPRLEELSLIWETFDNDKDFRLEYWDISMTLAMHTPNLRKLTLDASHGWENNKAGRQPSSHNPIAHKLEVLKHLEHLTLDTHAIYGPENRNSGSCLKENVPKGVTNLTLVCGTHDPDEDDEWTQEYLDGQDKDLIDLLQDPTFDCLSNVQLWRRARLLPPVRDAAEKHGWEVLLQEELPQHAEDFFVRLVNPARSRNEYAHPST